MVVIRRKSFQYTIYQWCIYLNYHGKMCCIRECTRDELPYNQCGVFNWTKLPLMLCAFVIFACEWERCERISKWLMSWRETAFVNTYITVILPQLISCDFFSFVFLYFVHRQNEATRTRDDSTEFAEHDCVCARTWVAFQNNSTQLSAEQKRRLKRFLSKYDPCISGIRWDFWLSMIMVCLNELKSNFH